VSYRKGRFIVSYVNLRLTEEERDLVVEALDSHVYWQMSEPHRRNDGFVFDMTPEELAVEELGERIAAAPEERVQEMGLVVESGDGGTIRHRVYAGDGHPDDARDYSDWTTEELIAWFVAQARTEQDGDFLRVEIHTYEEVE
jgi:hypothetical protein